jgi:glycosyltransferase involved in cell wall biosynthesis
MGARRARCCCYVGRLAAEKNVTLALCASSGAAARRPRAWWWSATARCVRKLPGDSSRRRFAGVQRGEALARHYASADLFLFPSLSETFGNVTLEALASGLPVIASTPRPPPSTSTTAPTACCARRAPRSAFVAAPAAWPGSTATSARARARPAQRRWARMARRAGALRARLADTVAAMPRRLATEAALAA